MSAATAEAGMAFAGGGGGGGGGAGDLLPPNNPDIFKLLHIQVGYSANPQMLAGVYRLPWHL